MQSTEILRRLSQKSAIIRTQFSKISFFVRQPHIIAKRCIESPQPNCKSDYKSCFQTEPSPEAGSELNLNFVKRSILIREMALVCKVQKGQILKSKCVCIYVSPRMQ